MGILLYLCHVLLQRSLSLSLGIYGQPSILLSPFFIELGLQVPAATPNFLHGHWGLELKILCSNSKCLYPLSHPPNPSLFFLEYFPNVSYIYMGRIIPKVTCRGIMVFTGHVLKGHCSKKPWLTWLGPSLPFFPSASALCCRRRLLRRSSHIYVQFYSSPDLM